MDKMEYLFCCADRDCGLLKDELSDQLYGVCFKEQPPNYDELFKKLVMVTTTIDAIFQEAGKSLDDPSGANLVLEKREKLEYDWKNQYSE